MKQQNTKLEIPVEVPLDDVESRLSEIWEMEGTSALVRACSCNLIAIAKDREEAQGFPVLLAAVAEQYPCRAIIVYREAHPGGDCVNAGPHIHTWISAHCTLPVSGEPQVCSEIITVASCGAAPRDVSNTVASLLVPDLPVFAYWRSFHQDQESLARQLAAYADVLVVDSHALKTEPHSRNRLLELLNTPPKGIAVRDINWARLTAWRDLIAQFFDPPSARPWVYRITEVEIHRAVDPGSIPTRTLLLTGWLATRLNWEWIDSRRTGDHWYSRWKSRNGEVDVRFLPDESEPDREPGITSLTLKIEAGPLFAVGRQGASHMTASAESQEQQVIHSVLQESIDEASLLVGELLLSGADPVFQQAVGAALALEKSFAP